MISVVVPVYNEVDSLPQLSGDVPPHRRMSHLPGETAQPVVLPPKPEALERTRSGSSIEVEPIAVLQQDVARDPLKQRDLARTEDPPVVSHLAN